jgi:hypothetical protein
VFLQVIDPTQPRLCSWIGHFGQKMVFGAFIVAAIKLNIGESSIMGESQPHAFPEWGDLYRPKSLKWADELMQDTLPPATIITLPVKMPAIISLSCAGICGEEDFRCR